MISGCGCISKNVEEPVEEVDKIDKIVISSPFFPLVMPMAYIVENNMLDEVADDVEVVPADVPHSLEAKKPFKMILTVVKKQKPR